MGMDRNSCMRSLQRVFVLQHFSPDEVGPYAEAIYESCGWIDALRFEAVCKSLAGELKSNVRLKPGHFIGRYKVLASENNWDKAAGAARTCNSCGGIGFVYIWVRDEIEREYKAMKGCGSCNERMSSVRSGLTEIDPPIGSSPTIEDLKINPIHAKILVNIADKAGFKLNDALWEKLLHCASKTDECLESIERRVMDPSLTKREESRSRERFLSDDMLKAHYANFQKAEPSTPPLPSPKPAPAPAEELEKPVPIQSTPTKISAEDAATMDMPF